MSIAMIHRLATFAMLVVFFSAAAGCAKDDPAIALPDYFDLVGLTGTRNLVFREVGGITSMAVPCCDTLTIASDDQPADFTGRFSISSIGFEAEGTVTVNPDDSTLLFVYNTTERVNGYEVLPNGRLHMWYTTENGALVNESWAIVEN